jgi:DNA repair protein SbcC/Rad50
MFFVHGKGCSIMLITRLELENIKSYKQVTVNFQQGTTAISGANGAGKTTLVEAIGFALFDSMPYKQEQFVREGEKYGRVVVHLLGNDDRPYEVERRCGAGALWTLCDREANYRLEQRADVQDKLHELFGIEREHSLGDLFHDALGVPQGAFTSIFLQTASKRKQTFDALLQIEDYRTAFDYLLEAQKQYKEQLLQQDREIQRLTFETRDLDNWRTTLKTAHEQDQELKARNLASNRRLNEQQTYASELKQRQTHLRECEHQRQHYQQQSENTYEHFEKAERALEEARAAHQAVEENRSHHERYCQTEETLVRLRREERQRNALRENRAKLDNTLSTTQAKIEHIQQRLDEIAWAHQRILELIPEVEEQNELEKQIERLAWEVREYENLRKEGTRLYKLREGLQQQQATTHQRIAAIEPLQPLADQLHERLEHITRLNGQRDQRTAKKLQLEEKQQALQEKKNELSQTVGKLRSAEEKIKKIEAHRQEGEEFSHLQERQQELERQKHHLCGNIESYTDSRNRSAGGQCPLLHQTCLNIQQQGQLSLEAYFEGLLIEEQALLAKITEQLTRVSKRSTAVKKHAEDLEKLGVHREQQGNYADHAERLNIEIRRQEREVQSLQEEWASLQQIDQEIAQAQALLKESQKADEQTRQLPGLSSKMEQLQAQIDQYTSEFEEKRREAEPLMQSKEQLQMRQQELKQLDDPRSKSKTAQETVKMEASYGEQLARCEETLRNTTHQLDELALQLETYTHLDRSLSEQEAVRELATAGHQLYLQNEKLAKSLPERTQAYEEAQQKMEQARRDLADAEYAYEQAATVFDEQEFLAVEAEITALHQEISRLASEMKNLQERMNKLEGDIASAEALLLELEAAQNEKKTLEDLSTMMEQFRKLILEAKPHVLREMLKDISAEANRIFGEIMGDRSAQLIWADEYEITLLRQGTKRSFAQLSGGEQMSAALAVRLALLKKLSAINIAFFDEPTQNMDEQRRTNLAEQIRRVRGFDQLIVISHDDTFEQGLDSLIRLRKQDGQTRLMNEDDALSLPISEQVDIYAS